VQSSLRRIDATTRRALPAVAAALALSSWLEAPRVWSQPQPAQGPTSSADGPREWFTRGLRALDSGRYDDAIRAFERSYALRASPVVLYNLGLALRGAGRIREAISALERFAQRPADGTTAAQLRAVTDEITRLRASLATLEIDITPRAARAVIDAAEVLPTRGTFTIDPGTHTVVMSLDGYRSETRLVSAPRARSTTLIARLEASDQSPHLQVEPSVASAEVLVDDRLVGRGAIDTMTSEGAHTVVVRAAGYREVRRAVRIGSAGSTRLVIELQRESGLRPWAVGLIVGGVALSAIIVGGTVAALSSTPRVYAPPPRTNLGWLGNAFEQRTQ
jgi:hypothetical protein